MATNKDLGLGTKVIVFGCAIVSIFEAVRIAIGHTEDLRNLYVRWAVVLGFLTWAVVYQTLKEDPRFKAGFGGIALIASILLIFYQLTKLGQTGWDKAEAVDRCMFLLGGIALLAKGLKDVFEEEGV
jgi:hypothetical protein